MAIAGKMSLSQLAAELERRESVKADYVVPTSLMSMSSHGDALTFPDSDGGTGEHILTDHAQGQLSTYLGIPRQYYRRMQAECPALLAQSVNTWLGRKDEKRLVRTLDGSARAVLSDRFRPIDNFEVAEAALPTLLQSDVQIRDVALTEQRMYLQAVSPKLSGEVKPGDTVQGGIMISNSEIGVGAIKVEALLWRLICLNGMVRPASLNKYHVGRRLGSDYDESAAHVFRAETREADNRAFLMKARDVIEAAFNEVWFNADLEAARASTEDTIEATAVESVVSDVTDRFSLTEGEKSGVLAGLIEGADLSRWGLINAVTSQAHNAESYDRVVELQRAGSDLLDVPIVKVA
jgi:hypothetical protein